MTSQQELKEEFERVVKNDLCLDKDEDGEFTDKYTFSAWKWYELGYKVGYLDLNNPVVELKGRIIDVKTNK